jgi:hypothetical protein
LDRRRSGSAGGLKANSDSKLLTALFATEKTLHHNFINMQQDQKGNSKKEIIVLFMTLKMNKNQEKQIPELLYHFIFGF